MSNKLIKFRNESFAGYGLDKNKNFLQAPKCECGCGGSCSVLLKNREELFSLMYDLLEDNECDCCAVFAHSYDENFYVAIKTDVMIDDEDDEPIKFFGIENDLDFFRDWADNVGLHCYGLLIEHKRGSWKIIEN